MDRKFVCSGDGTKGGLILLWKSSIIIDQLALHHMYINVKVKEGDFLRRFTGMYGEFRWENKFETWNRMCQLHQSHTLPWLQMGDLNEIQFLHEKEGEIVDPNNTCKSFKMLLKIVICGTWGTLGTRLLGEEEESEKDLTEV